MTGLPKITTRYWMKPIQPLPHDGGVRRFDWEAFYADDEPNDAGSMDVGFGATEAEAVVDLIENYPRGYPDCERDMPFVTACSAAASKGR